MATTTSGTRPHLPLPTTGRLATMNITIYGWTTSPGRSVLVGPPGPLPEALGGGAAALGLDPAGRRGLGVARAAASSSANRSTAARRLASWLRWAWATTRSTPPESSRGPRRRTASSLASSVSDGDPARSKRSSTRESVVFTPCPPGPEARLARNSSSATGMAISGVIRTASATSSLLVAGPGRHGALGQVVGRVDEGDVGERLGEVAELAAGRRVELLSQQADVVAEGEEALEDGQRLLTPAHQGQVVGQPEGAGQERPLAGRQPVHRLRPLGRVAVDEAVDHQLALDGRHRGLDPRVAGGQEPDQRDLEQAGVQVVGPVELDEGVALGVVALPAHLVVELAADRPPAVDRALVAAQLDRLDGPVERHPGHHLGVGEVPPGPADLPDALVRLAPLRLQELEQGLLEVPGRLVALQADVSAKVQGVHHLAVDVELKLVHGRVADPHWP